MADHTAGDGSSNLQTVDSGDSELDEKIAEWLHLDKVTGHFANIRYASLMCYYRKYFLHTCYSVSDQFASGIESAKICLETIFLPCNRTEKVNVLSFLFTVQLHIRKAQLHLPSIREPTIVASDTLQLYV